MSLPSIVKRCALGQLLRLVLPEEETRTGSNGARRCCGRPAGSRRTIGISAEQFETMWTEAEKL